MKTSDIKNKLLDFYKNPVAQVSTELFLTVGAIIFFALFAIRPTVLTMSDLINELEEKEKLSEKFRQKIATLSTLQAQYQQIRNDAVILLDEAFPNDPELTRVLKSLEKLASENQLIIDTIQVAEIPTAEASNSATLSSYPLSITVYGEYENIRSFSEGILNLRRMLTIDSITFQTEEDRNTRKLSATIAVNAQYFGGGK